MLTLRESSSGDFHFNRQLTEDDRAIGFWRLTVYPRAAKLFREVGLRDGSKVPIDVIYALMLEGEIGSPINQVRPFTYAQLPIRAQRMVAHFADSHGIRALSAQLADEGRFTAMAIYQGMVANGKNPAALLSVAKVILYRHMKAFAAARDHRQIRAMPYG